MMSDTVRSARYHEKEKYESYRYQRKQRKIRRRDRRNAREKKRRHARLVKKYGESVAGPCTRKIRYKSKSGALTYIRNNHEPIDLYVYKCPYCGGMSRAIPSVARRALTGPTHHKIWCRLA